jgi:hypothetical protein
MKPIKAVQCSVLEDKFVRMNGWISWSMPTFSEVTKDSHVNPQSGQLNSLIDSALLLHKHIYTSYKHSKQEWQPLLKNCLFFLHYISVRKHIYESANAHIYIFISLFTGEYDPKQFQPSNIQSDSTLLSGFPFTGHGNPENNLESSCITATVPQIPLSNGNAGLKFSAVI